MRLSSSSLARWMRLDAVEASPQLEVMLAHLRLER